MVQVGQQVNPGDILAKSNMTDDQGQIALGMNANVIMIPWKGLNFEDAMVVSQSFADKLKSQHMYQSKIDWNDEHRRGKHSFMGIFPSTYSKKQLDKMDDNGIIQVGQEVNQGDPLILAARDTSKGKKTGRKLFNNGSLTWEHHDPGIVTDVFHSDKGATVLVKNESTLKTGSKLCYDGLTDVLTEDGWKPVAEVTCRDSVACLKDGQLCYEQPDATHMYPRGGRMYHVETKNLDLLVTENHGMYVRKRSRDYFELLPAKDIYGKTVTFKKDAEWVGSDPEYVVIPEIEVKAGQSGNGVRTIPEIHLDIPTYMLLLGAYIADGNLVNHVASGSYGIDICKPVPQQRSNLIDGLGQLDVKFTECSNGEKIRIYSKQLMQFFRDTVGSGAKGKRIPASVFSYSKESLTSLFYWLMNGDGHKHKDTGRYVDYSTVSPELAGDVQRLCLHIGKAANIIAVVCDARVIA